MSRVYSEEERRKVSLSVLGRMDTGIAVGQTQVYRVWLSNHPCSWVATEEPGQEEIWALEKMFGAQVRVEKVWNEVVIVPNTDEVFFSDQLLYGLHEQK